MRLLIILLILGPLYSQTTLRFFPAFPDERDGSIRVILSGATHPNQQTLVKHSTRSFESNFMAQHYFNPREYELSPGQFEKEYVLEGKTARLASGASQIPLGSKFLICEATKAGDGIQEIMSMENFIYQTYENEWDEIGANLIAQLTPKKSIGEYSGIDGGLIAIYFPYIESLYNDDPIKNAILPVAVQARHDSSATYNSSFWQKKRAAQHSLVKYMDESPVEKYSLIQPILLKSSRQGNQYGFLSISALALKEAESEVIFMDNNAVDMVPFNQVAKGRITKCFGVIRLNPGLLDGDIVQCYVHTDDYSGGVALFMLNKKGLFSEVYFSRLGYFW